MLDSGRSRIGHLGQMRPSFSVFIFYASLLSDVSNRTVKHSNRTVKISIIDIRNELTDIYIVIKIKNLK